MKNIFLNCRKIDKKLSLKKKIINTVLFTILGILLGFFSKCIDEISIDDSIMWQRLLGVIDLRNVFSRLAIWALFGLVISIYSITPKRAAINTFLFFLGMMSGYYIFESILFGFIPSYYILRWGIVCIFVPLLAYITWYAKGDSKISRIITTILISFFASQAFIIGFGYFYITYIPEIFILGIALILLYDNPDKTTWTTLLGFVLSPIYVYIMPYIFGGL